MFLCRTKSLLGLMIVSLVIPFSASSQKLGEYHVAKDRVYVAGISSGGYMAVQMDVAYSSMFKGAAIYAGGPDYCAQGDVLKAISTCLADAPVVDTAALTSAVRKWAAQGLIDPLSNLAGQQIYLWSGLLDSLVRPPLMDALKTQYESLGADVFQYDNHFLAAHGWESPDGSAACAQSQTPYIMKCNQGPDDRKAINPADTRPYDSEQVWLTRWLGKLNPRNVGAPGGSLLPYAQSEFSTGKDAAGISLDSTGYIFVPKDCQAGAVCGLLLTLHGCNESYSAVGKSFIQDAGINQWADTNHLIVLYPQAISSGSSGANPQGCWNWWGYLNDPDYATRNGAQMQALHAMVLRAEGRQ